MFSFKGVESKFFFYKITYGEDEYTSYMLACAGPFNIDGNNIFLDEATGDLLYDEDFDSYNLPEQMDRLLKQMEERYSAEEVKNQRN